MPGLVFWFLMMPGFRWCLGATAPKSVSAPVVSSSFARPSGRLDLGNAPARFIRLPWIRNTDLSFFKNFQLHGSKRIQIRWEIYNLFNTPNFVNPNSQLGNPAFGQISSTGNSIPRQMQFAAKLLF